MESVISETTTNKADAQRSLKERQRREREELILHAAEQVLLEKGYHDASMEEIAARVGIAKGTVYLHFPSKDDMVVALFEQELLFRKRAIAAIMAQPASARSRLEDILGLTYSGARASRTQLFMALNASIGVRKGLIEKRQELHSHMGQMAADIRMVLEQGKAAGEFDGSIPTSIMLSAFLALLMPRVHENLVGQDDLTPEERAKYVARLFFHGITAQ